MLLVVDPFLKEKVRFSFDFFKKWDVLITNLQN
jgi:hypothetical protein